MRCWLAVSGLLLMASAVPAAASPVERWKDGDWWELQLEHVTMHHHAPRLGWTPSFRLRFQVARGPQEVRVEVTTEPENRFRERLVLRYSPSGELLSAQVVDEERVWDLGPAGGFGPFGMLGREAFVMTRAPALPAGSHRLVRVAIDDAGTAQIWGAKEPWWLQYETLAGVPQRATLVNASWRQAPDGQGTVTTGPGGLPIGPGDPTSSGNSGGGSPAPPASTEPPVPAGSDAAERLPKSTAEAPGETAPGNSPPGGALSPPPTERPPSPPEPAKGKKPKRGWSTRK